MKERKIELENVKNIEPKRDLIVAKKTNKLPPLVYPLNPPGKMEIKEGKEILMSEDPLFMTDEGGNPVQSLPIPKSSNKSKCCCLRSRKRVVEEKESRFNGLSKERKSEAIRDLWQWAIKQVIWKKSMGLFMGNLLNNSKQPYTGRKLSLCLLLPGSTFINIWDAVMLVFLLYFGTITPFVISYLDEIPELFMIMQNIILVVFFIDIFIHFFTAYYDHHQLIKDKKAIAMHYLCTWFIIDLISCIPTNLFLEDDDDSRHKSPFQSTRIIRLLTLLKLIKLLRLRKFINSFIDDISIRFRLLPEIGRGLVAFISILFFVHLFACGWFLMARFGNFDQDTWVIRVGCRDATIQEQYLIALYWVLQTLTSVGYGDVAAVTNYERVFSVCLMSFGVAFYSSLFQPMDKFEKNHRGLMMALVLFARKYNLPNELVAKIRNHLNLHSAEDYFDRLGKKGILENLPKSLRNEVILNTHGVFLNRIKVLKGKALKLLWLIGNKLKLNYYSPGDVIYTINDLSDRVYFVKKGTVNVFNDEGLKVNSFSNNTMFGSAEAIDNKPRLFGAVASDYCQINFILRDDLVRILREYPSVREEMHTLGKKANHLWFQQKEPFVQEDEIDNKVTNSKKEEKVKSPKQAMKRKGNKLHSRKSLKPYTHKQSLKQSKSIYKRKSMLVDRSAPPPPSPPLPPPAARKPILKYEEWKRNQTKESKEEQLRNLKGEGESEEVMTEMQKIEEIFTEINILGNFQKETEDNENENGSENEEEGEGEDKKDNNLQGYIAGKLRWAQQSLFNVLLYFNFIRQTTTAPTI